MQVVVGHPGSLYLTGNLHCRIELTYSVRNAFLRTFVFLFTVIKSFRNLVYEGICWMASKKGMLIWTCLNTSIMSSNFPSFLGACSLSGYGTLGTNDQGGSFTIGVAVDGSASLSSLLPLTSLSYPVVSTSGSTTWLSTCLPDLSVTITCICSCPCAEFEEFPIANALGFGSGWLGNFPFSLSPKWFAICPIWFSIFAIAWVLTMVAFFTSWMA